MQALGHAIQKRLDVKQSLGELFAVLDSYQAAIPLAVLEEGLKNSEVAGEDIRRAISFGDKTYRRNLLHGGPAYHALVMCWRPGQRSPIHDHCGSSCAAHVLQGVATETAFAITAQGHVYATSSGNYAAGSVIGSFDSDAHQISNLQPPGEDLLTLHIYSPPLLQMKRFSLTDSHVEIFVESIELFGQGAWI